MVEYGEWIDIDFVLIEGFFLIIIHLYNKCIKLKDQKCNTMS